MQLVAAKLEISQFLKAFFNEAGTGFRRVWRPQTFVQVRGAPCARMRSKG